MREEKIRELQLTLDEGHFIIISKKSVIDYLLGTQLFNGVLLIGKSKICIINKYLNTKEDKEFVISKCTNNIIKEFLTYTKKENLKVMYADFENTSYRLITLAKKSMQVIHMQVESIIIHKALTDEDCVQINGILLTEIIKNWKDEINKGDSLFIIINKFKSIAFRFGAEDAFASISPVGLDLYSIYEKISDKYIYLFDFGIKYKGLFSDCTITVKFSRYEDKEVFIIKKLCAIQNEIVRNIKVDQKIGLILDKALAQIHFDYGESISIGFGHSIGIDIHEGLSITRGGNDTFIDRMIFTLEPQITINSFENFSPRVFRIESTFTIFDGKIRNYFSKIPCLNEL